MLTDEGAWTNGTKSPDAAEIRSAVLRISASPPFVQSRRMQQFLHYIVENTLEGNRDRLKETIVGIAVFERRPGYDPKLDSIVRTEARRLRSKLEEYYATTGASESIVIHLNKGAYVPVFEVPGERSSSGPSETLATTEKLLERLVPASTIDGALPETSRHWKRTAFAVTTIALLLASVCWYGYSRSGEPLAVRVTPLTGNAGTETNPAFSPDGRQIAYSWKQERGDFDIYVKLVDLGDPIRLTRNSGHNVNPSWSPDGQRIAFFAQRRSAPRSL